MKEKQMKDMENCLKASYTIKLNFVLLLINNFALIS